MPAPDAAFAARRTACEFGAGRLARETIGEPWNATDMSALKHVIIVMQENRSFDHYFSELKQLDLPDRPEPDACNEDARHHRITRFHETRMCVRAPDHEWTDAHLAAGNGCMNGFVFASAPGGERAMGYYDGTDLPFYYALAHRFAISDRYFSPLLGPTTPNRLFLYFGTSFDFADAAESDPRAASVFFSERPRSIGDVARGSIGVFLEDVSNAGLLGKFSSVLGLQSIEDFERLAMVDEAAHPGAGLPRVSIVNAQLGKDDEHGPSNPQIGQRFSHRIVSTLARSPAWRSSVLFLTYDENGGYYDHVLPPAACDPSEAKVSLDFPFDQYGFRVPFIAISPFAKRSYVSHYDADHTSILRFIELWLGTGALTRRDANSWPLLDMFDFSKADTGDVPLDSSLVALSPTGEEECRNAPPDGADGLPKDP